MTQPIASYAVETNDADQTRALGEDLGRVLAAGDLVMLSGGLGAGKTTLTQGIGVGMGVRGRVASPTFIVARVHPNLGGGPFKASVDKNGTLEVTVRYINGMHRTQYEHIGSVDDQPPLISGDELDGNMLTVSFDDPQSGINYDSIYAMDADEERVLPSSIDESENKAVFQVLTSRLEVHISDQLGHEAVANFTELDAMGNGGDNSHEYHTYGTDDKTKETTAEEESSAEKNSGKSSKTQKKTSSASTTAAASSKAKETSAAAKTTAASSKAKETSAAKTSSKANAVNNSGAPAPGETISGGKSGPSATRESKKSGSTAAIQTVEPLNP